MRRRRQDKGDPGVEPGTALHETGIYQRGEEVQVLGPPVYATTSKRLDASVRQHDTADISNHLPLLVRLLLPAGTDYCPRGFARAVGSATSGSSGQ